MYIVTFFPLFKVFFRKLSSYKYFFFLHVDIMKSAKTRHFATLLQLAAITWARYTCGSLCVFSHRV